MRSHFLRAARRAGAGPREHKQRSLPVTCRRIAEGPEFRDSLTEPGTAGNTGSPALSFFTHLGRVSRSQGKGLCPYKRSIGASLPDSWVDLTWASLKHVQLSSPAFGKTPFYVSWLFILRAGCQPGRSECLLEGSVFHPPPSAPAAPALTAPQCCAAGAGHAPERRCRVRVRLPGIRIHDRPWCWVLFRLGVVAWTPVRFGRFKRSRATERMTGTFAWERPCFWGPCS